MNISNLILISGFLLFLSPFLTVAQTSSGYLKDSFAKLRNGFTPQTVDDLWKGYDPSEEPLDIEVPEQWEEDGVIYKVVRYRACVFRGRKSMIAALYAYPKGGQNLPGLVQVHGGGQHANLNVVMTNAKRDYACISVNWLANKMRGLKNGKEWEWDGINTDWGALDATQNTHNNHFYTLMPDTCTIDSIYSARNSNWFLGVLAIRRAITFLQNQPEVNPNLIGLYGHSMGGKLTFDVSAIDSRVKVAAPSAAAQLGIEKKQESEIMWRTIASHGYASYQNCPLFFIVPTNDFFGRIEDIEATIDAIPNKNYTLCRIPHENHRTQPNYTVCGLLWMDQYLKGNFSFPANPEVTLSLDSQDKVPCFFVKPYITNDLLGVDIYYSQGSEATSRYWEWVKAERKDSIWYGKCPVLSTTDTLRVFANVSYKLPYPVTGASFYFKIYTADSSFTISSRMLTATPRLMKMHEIKATNKTSEVIENFDEHFKKRWYVNEEDDKWPYRTHKLNDKKWMAPAPDANLSLEVKVTKNNVLQIEVDDYIAKVELKGNGKWQEIDLKPSDFNLKENPAQKNLPQTLQKWSPFIETALGPGNSNWKGELPTFRNFKWKIYK